MSLGEFGNISLRRDYLLVSVPFAADSLGDAIGRPAQARTLISGRHLKIELTGNLPPEEVSISIYHEILEAMTVAVDDPPAKVMEMNEADFESAAQAAHQNLGAAAADNLPRFLE